MKNEVGLVPRRIGEDSDTDVRRRLARSWQI